MPRRHSSEEEEDEEEEEEDEDDGEDDEERPPRRRRSRRHGRPAVQEWTPEPTDEDAQGEDDEDLAHYRIPRHWTKERWPIFFRARDSLYFEPLVALAIIVVLLVSLWAFTQNWPPMYVVESSSMQHGGNDQLGLINTGDIVLAQKLPLSEIQPYVVGLVSGYVTY
ncbi:MAG TPA: S26 family signal peptidase, partial [Thermoplasmata archaeon]|nr:S26 family signal peptidase [Thermoplasmata archaeon]